MKTFTLVLFLSLTALGLWAQAPAPAPGLPPPIPRVPPAPPAPAAPEREVAGYTFNYQGVDVNQVLDVYANLVGRTLLRGTMPQASIVLKTQSPLTKTEAIEALQAVLAMNGIAVVNMGDKFAKVGQTEQANTWGAPFSEIPASQLPDLGTYVIQIVQLKWVKPSVMVPLIQPFARLPNGITAIDDNGILVIRDYAENIKRMMEMIARIDVNVPAVYISEVIPIKYAQADDIANALNSLGGSGGTTVSVGSAPSVQRISGLAGGNTASGMGASGFGATGTTPQPGGNTPTSAFGQPPGSTPYGSAANPNGTPSSATPFQRRLLNIINQAGGGGGGGGGAQQPIQIFGMAKIIADERSNSLLIFATRQDMEMIKKVISQLDVLLAQVLIESAVIDYSLGPNTVNFGISAAQNPQNYSYTPPVVGGGGINNGQSLLSLLSGNFSGTSNGVSSFASALPGGLSYFGNIGPKWDVALSAAASDSHSTIIQRPSIMTSQAKPAQFFVGETVPYVTSTLNYGGAYGNQSSYSQLSVGVELDVTPFINPDGLVVMEIQQEIDALDGYTTITGVGQIPNTTKRTLSSEIAVRNLDTVILGGFINNQKSLSRSGVPLLQDIPLLGTLFSSRNTSKQREELIVMMRPTVLATPALAAAHTIMEGRRLPQVSAAIAEDQAEQARLMEDERKLETSHTNSMSQGYYNMVIPTNTTEEESSPPQDQTFYEVPPSSIGAPAGGAGAAPPKP